MALPNPPSWWHWDFELSTHVEQRMHERGITEVELRAMLDRATTLEPSVLAGRFVACCKHRGRPWRIVLEPDTAAACVVVVTVYLKEVP
jgi:hypothetical protein